MENVKGMTTGNMVGIYGEALVEFQRIGYRTASAVINFSRLGVPQKRERLVVIGIREDLSVDPSHPDPIAPVRTVRDAFRDLRCSNRKEHDLGLDTKSRAVRALTSQGQSSAQILMSRGFRGSFFSDVRLHYDKPSNTITSRGPRPFHPTMDRLITSDEVARVGSFPDQYDWGDSDANLITKRVGNSVPPLGMHYIAEHIKTLLAEAKE
jgi:DNA (cytosine-5)-methyltransferase 1